MQTNETVTQVIRADQPQPQAAAPVVTVNLGAVKDLVKHNTVARTIAEDFRERERFRKDPIDLARLKRNVFHGKPASLVEIQAFFEALQRAGAGKFALNEQGEMRFELSVSPRDIGIQLLGHAQPKPKKKAKHVAHKTVAPVVKSQQTHAPELLCAVDCGTRTIKINIPSDITVGEAKRLTAFIEGLASMEGA